MTDPVQQAREALEHGPERWGCLCQWGEDGNPVGEHGPRCGTPMAPHYDALRDLLAHVETLIDPADLEALGYCDLQYRGVHSGDYAWALKMYSQASTHYAASAAEAIRAAREAQP